jgi:hypothetical protein
VVGEVLVRVFTSETQEDVVGRAESFSLFFIGYLKFSLNSWKYYSINVVIFFKKKKIVIGFFGWPDLQIIHSGITINLEVSVIGEIDKSLYGIKFYKKNLTDSIK